MYKRTVPRRSGLRVNTSTQGEPIERKIERYNETGEAISSEVPLIYTERKQGVLSPYDPRTDKWELATETHDDVSKANIAAREGRLKIVKDGEADGVDGSGEQSQNQNE